VDQNEPNCVVLGDAAEYFTYDAMNAAFRLLLKLKDQSDETNTILYTLGRGLVVYLVYTMVYSAISYVYGSHM